MSSATSTDAAERPRTPDQGLQPWQFFVLAALGCATAVTFLARGQGVIPIILLAVLMGSAVFAALAMLRTLSPLVSAAEDRTPMIGQRTRAALEREKHLTLRAIKELEFDRAMGKLAEADFQEMSGRLRARAAGLIRQLDAGSGYRDQIERDLATRLNAEPALRKQAGTASDHSHAASDHSHAASDHSAATDHSAGPTDQGRVVGDHTCAHCATVNDPDARFCKGCGARL